VAAACDKAMTPVLRAGDSPRQPPAAPTYGNSLATFPTIVHRHAHKRITFEHNSMLQRAIACFLTQKAF
jgi:hypothetical protein